MTGSPSQAAPRVSVVDDDVNLCAALARLLRSVGLEVATFTSPDAFLAEHLPSDRGCLLLDIRFPRTNGLDFQTELAAADVPMPVIMMSGHADVASSIRGLKSGAVDFLIKPFGDADLIRTVESALAMERELWASRAQVLDARKRYDLLTDREKEVFALVTTGLMNKQVAADLGLSEVTVKIHRGTMMRKMDVRTLADLVRAAVTLKLAVGRSVAGAF